jgi:hypothetical protein
MFSTENYSMFSYINTGKRNIKTACTNGLPDDEHVMFEICRRHKKFI